MVAHDPRQPSRGDRSLSAAAIARTRDALVAHWTGRPSDLAELEAALLAATAEARERGLRPESLLIALRAIETEVANEVACGDLAQREHLRHWLVNACLRAYFAQDGDGTPR